LHLEVTVPVNTKADVVLPVSVNEVIYESGKEINKNSDVKILSRQADHLRLVVGSGKYIFEMNL
jgi:hypothetical protein